MTTAGSWSAYKCRPRTRRPSRTSSTAWAIHTGMKAITPRTGSSSSKNGAPFSYRPRLGLEMEMVVADAQSGASLPVRRYFEALAAVKRRKGVDCEPYYLDGRCVGLSTARADCGLD